MATIPGLFDGQDLKEMGAASYHEVFRQIYYDLYSNSDASRAERIFEDLAKLLLVKFLLDTHESEPALRSFTEGRASANDVLLPALSDRFPDLIADRDVFTLGDSVIRKGLADLQPIDLVAAPSAILGEAFQALIGPRLRGDHGQFFTPRELVKTMVAIAAPQPSDKIVDPAAGTGGFLVEAHAYRKRRFPQHRKWGNLIGVEKDRDLQRLGGAMVNIATQGIGKIICANSLLLDPEQDPHGPSPFDADVVLTNPPFGARIGIRDKDVLSRFDLGHVWAFSASDNVWHKDPALRPTQDPQILFIEACLRLLKPDGILGIVLPEGIFGNRRSGYIWDFVRSCGRIEVLIDCPRTTFQPGTDTKTNVVFIRKTNDDNRQSTNVSIAVAKHCGHDRRGRSITPNGNRIQNDFETIRKHIEKVRSDCWADVRIPDPYYLVPRYHFGRRHNHSVKLARAWGSETTKFKELTDSKAIRVRKGNEVGAENYGTGKVPFVRTSDINNCEVSLNPTNGVSEEVYEHYRNQQGLGALDILLVVDGRYRIGRTAILHENDYRCVVQSHFRIITVKDNSPLTPYEMLYVLNRPEVLTEIRNLVFIQSTLGSIGKRLGELVLPTVNRSDDRLMRNIERFSRAIEQRAEALASLRVFQTPEPEL